MPSHHPSPIALNELIEQAVQNYFVALEGEVPTNVYELIIAEVEKPLFKVVLEQAGGNQTKAAKILGMNRGTFRKKLTQYDML